MVAGRSHSKERTLEDLFRPPIDMTYKGMFETVCFIFKIINKAKDDMCTYVGEWEGIE